MAHKQMLHELLKEDQEPFRLKSYIADRKSQMKNSSLQLKKRSPIASKRSVLSKHACFLSFQNSPDVRRSPFLNFQSPAKSPCKSPNNAVFLHIPSRTAALLVEAAMRVQKQPKSETGFGLFGSFLKRLKDRSRKQKRAIQNSDFFKVEETVRISCSCSNRRLSSAEWTENNEDFEASTSSCASEFSEHDFGLSETRFCSSPFRFSLQGSPSPCGRRTPDFCSPAASPSRHVRLDERNDEARKSENVQGGEEEEEKEQCSPVSVLDPPFHEDDGHESGDAEEDDYDLECSYENVQRAKQQLLHRLRRFEKLAELDPMELERKLLEGSDDDDWSGEDEPLPLYKKESVETFVSQVLNQSSTQYHTDMKRLVSDLIVEEKSEANDVVMGRIRTRFDLWKEVEFNTIDMMVGLDLKRESDGWTRYDEQIGETTAEIEVGIFALLIEELSDEFCC